MVFYFVLVQWYVTTDSSFPGYPFHPFYKCHFQIPAPLNTTSATHTTLSLFTNPTCESQPLTTGVTQNTNVKNLLYSKLVFADRHAVHKLNGRPEAVELGALVDVHDAVTRRRPVPDGVVQVGLDPGQHDLKHGQSAAQPLAGQQVALRRDVCLLKVGKIGDFITGKTQYLFVRF